MIIEEVIEYIIEYEEVIRYFRVEDEFGNINCRRFIRQVNDKS